MAARRSYPRCAGGVFRSSVRIRRSVTRHLRRQPQARVLLLRHPLSKARALNWSFRMTFHLYQVDEDHD
jgi:hypothetical protein